MVIFGLVIEYDKSEIFHFSRAYNDSNPELDILAIGAPTLKSKTYWKYLGFYFDWCLFFKKHVHYYSTKILLIGMLGNSTRYLLLLQKYLFYHSYIIPIATHGFRLWFFAKAPTKAQISLLIAIQHKLFVFLVHFALHPLVELRLWQVSFWFIFTLKS